MKFRDRSFTIFDQTQSTSEVNKTYDELQEELKTARERRIDYIKIWRAKF